MSASTDELRRALAQLLAQLDAVCAALREVDTTHGRVRAAAAELARASEALARASSRLR